MGIVAVATSQVVVRMGCGGKRENWGQIGANLPSVGPSLFLSLSQGCSPTRLSVEACVVGGMERDVGRGVLAG